MKDLTKKEKDNIANQLNKTGINFNNIDIELLCQGSFSSLKENVVMADGSIKDAKIKLDIDDDGKIKLQYQCKQPQIVIPNKLGNKIFTDEEKKALKNGELVQCQYGGENIFLQIDKQLNTIVVKTHNEINIKDVKHFEMGGYVFNEKEKELLDKGEKVPGVVMQGKEGYFVATIKITNDKKGFVYEGYKDLSKEQAKNLLSKKGVKNELETSNLSKDSITDKTDNAIENTTSSQTPHEKGNLSNTPEDKLKIYEDKLYTAIRKEDFKKVKTLSENQPPVSKGFIDKLNKDSTLSTEAKIASRTILKIEPKTHKKDIENKVNEKPVKIMSEEQKQKKKGNEKKVRTGKEIITKAFDDM